MRRFFQNVADVFWQSFYAPLRVIQAFRKKSASHHFKSLNTWPGSILKSIEIARIFENEFSRKTEFAGQVTKIVSS